MLDAPDHPHAIAWSSMTEEDSAAIDRLYVHIGKSIAAFERKLVSRRAPFDVFVEGVRDVDAYKQRSLTESARRGLKIFLGKGNCHICHSGPNFTDMEFHNNRVRPLEGGTSMDPGRFKGVERVLEDPFNGRGVHSDDPEAARRKIGFLRRSGHNWAEFKTPSLRNVVLSPPYMHEGQLATLADVLRHYSRLEGAAPTHHSAEDILRPFDLSEQETLDLTSFLESLTDTAIDSALMRAPDKPYLESR